MGFAGKVVIVTGAGHGIGKCVAEMYAAEGADVILAEKDASAGETAEKEIVDPYKVSILLITNDIS